MCFNLTAGQGREREKKGEREGERKRKREGVALESSVGKVREGVWDELGTILAESRSVKKTKREVERQAGRMHRRKC